VESFNDRSFNSPSLLINNQKATGINKNQVSTDIFYMTSAGTENVYVLRDYFSRFFFYADQNKQVPCFLFLLHVHLSK